MFSLSTPKRCSLIWNDTNGLLTCGSSSHVSVGHPSSPSSSSSVLVIGAIFWPEVGHPLLVWGSVDRWPGRVGHLGDGTLWAVQSSRWKPGGTGHGKLLRSKREKENTWLRHDVFCFFFCILNANQCRTILTSFTPISDPSVCGLLNYEMLLLAIICMSTDVCVVCILCNR